jgi:hypothetical protein
VVDAVVVAVDVPAAVVEIAGAVDVPAAVVAEDGTKLLCQDTQFAPKDGKGPHTLRPFSLCWKILYHRGTETQRRTKQE